MNKVKRWLAVFLSAVLLTAALTACGSTSESASDSSVEEADDTVADDAAVEVVALSIGVIMTYTDNGYGLTVKQYLDAIGEELHIEFNYAAAQETEEMTEAMENFVAAGVDGIMSMPTFNTVNEVEYCAENGVYFALFGECIEDEDIWEQIKDNEYFVGAIGNDNAESTRGMVGVLAEEYGVETLGIVSLPMGTSNMHDGRYEGVIAGAEEYGVEIVVESLSYNLTEGAQNMVAQYPELDAIIALAGGIEECMQPIISAGLEDTMKFAGFREETGAEELFETGALAVLGVGTPINSIYGFINIYNAITGNLYTPDDQEKCNYALTTIYVANAEDYSTYCAAAMDSNPYTIEEIEEYLVIFNEEANYNDFETWMAETYNLDYLETTIE